MNISIMDLPQEREHRILTSRWSREIHDNPTVAQLVKRFLAPYETVIFKMTCHNALS